MPQLSIICPVYKTEQFLRRCVDSVLQQELRDFELILIDDGSPDECPQICDDYALMDSRIKVIHKTNGGVSAARNSGLDIAKGEYVTFVDSDDWIEPCMYQKMLETAYEYDCDVVMCDCVKEFQDHSMEYTHDIRGGFYNYDQLKNEYYPHLLMMENVEYPPTISNCLCVFRNDKENGVRYIEGVRFSEDLLFGAQMMFFARSFYYMKGEEYYHYYVNPESASHTFEIDKWKDYLVLYGDATQFFLDKTEYDFRHQLDLMLLFFVYNVMGDIHKTQYLVKMEKRKVIKKVLYNHEVREMFKRISIYKLKISWKLKIITCLYKQRICIG